MSPINFATILTLANTDVFTKVLEAWLKRGVRDRSLAITLQRPDGKVELAADTLNNAALDMLIKQVLARNSTNQVEVVEQKEPVS